MRINSLHLLGLTCLLIACLAGTGIANDGNIVLQWNNAMLQAVRNTGFPPMRVARGLAIAHTCIVGYIHQRTMK